MSSINENILSKLDNLRKEIDEIYTLLLNNNINNVEETPIIKKEYTADGKIKAIRTYNSKDELHSFNDEPAEIIYNYPCCNTCTRTYKNGKLHSFNGKPAVIIYYDNKMDNNKIATKKWYNEGMLQSFNNEPSKIYYYKSGSLSGKHWHNNGKLHSFDDKPAVISYNNNGDITDEMWYINGIKTRLDDKPCENRYQNNKIVEQSWNDENGKPKEMRKFY